MQQPIVLVKRGVVPWLARAALPIAKGSPVELGMQSWPAFGGALEKEHVPRFMPGVSFLRWDYPHLRIVAMTYSLHIETLMHHDFNVCTSSEKFRSLHAV